MTKKTNQLTRSKSLPSILHNDGTDRHQLNRSDSSIQDSPHTSLVIESRKNQENPLRKKAHLFEYQR